MSFPQQEYWTGIPFPSPDLSDPGTEPASPALPGRFFTLNHLGSHRCIYKVKVKSLSRVQLFATPCTVLSGSSVHGIFPGNSSGVDCHFLLQGIFPTQGLNLGLPHYRQTLYCLSHQGSPTREILKSLKCCELIKLIINHNYKHTTSIFTN